MSHTRVLQIIGTSKSPLSSREIEKRLGGSNSDIYRIVLELAGLARQDFELFSWDEIEENMYNGEYKRKLIRKLNHFCGLNLEVADKNNSDRNNEIIRFELLHTNEDVYDILVIEHTTSHLQIMIRINQKENKIIHDTAMFIIRNRKREKDFDLVAKHDSKGKVRIYTKDYDYSPIRFLKISYKNEQQQMIEKLQKNKQLSTSPDNVTDRGYDYVFVEDLTEQDQQDQKGIEEIRQNRRNFRYSLNIKGLLLYLLGPSDIHEVRPDPNIIGNEFKRSMNRSAISTRSITAVLSNQSKNYLNEFPFLLYYKDFEKLLGKSFMVKLFKDIGIELQNQLDTDNIEFLRYWVTKRYFGAINNLLPKYTYTINDNRMMSKMNVKMHIKLKHYRLYILGFLKRYQKKELEETNDVIRYIEERGLFGPSFIH